MKKKDMYISPQIEVIEMQNEGVIASSQLPGVGDGGSARAAQSREYNSAASSDLEDMINDILTLEQ